MNLSKVFPGLPTLCLCLGMALGLGPSPAAAEPDECFDNCHESRIQCSQATRDDYRSCRDSCNDSVRTAIADARESCQLDGVEREECRERVRTAARAAAEACRPDCRDAHRAARQVCHAEARTCGETCRGPIDEACAEQCHTEFQPCAEELRTCRGGCLDERRAGFRACRESSADRGQFRECVRAVHTETRECNMDCHDTLLCREQVHECLDSCRVDESSEPESDL